MDSNEFDHLMALLEAHAIQLAAIAASHPQPALLRTALATLEEKTQPRFDTACWLIYQQSLETFRKAIPPH